MRTSYRIVLLILGMFPLMSTLAFSDMPPLNGSKTYVSIWAQELKKGGLWNGPETTHNRTDYQPSA